MSAVVPHNLVLQTNITTVKTLFPRLQIIGRYEDMRRESLVETTIKVVAVPVVTDIAMATRMPLGGQYFETG